MNYEEREKIEKQIEQLELAERKLMETVKDFMPAWSAVQRVKRKVAIFRYQKKHLKQKLFDSD